MAKQRIIVWCDYEVYPEEWQTIADGIRSILRDGWGGDFSNVHVYVEEVKNEDGGE